MLLTQDGAVLVFAAAARRFLPPTSSEAELIIAEEFSWISRISTVDGGSGLFSRVSRCISSFSPFGETGSASEMSA